MNKPPRKIVALLLSAAFGTAILVRGQSLDQTGVTFLRAVTTNLNGTGIRVGQPEGYNGDNGSTNAWEVNPTNAAQPVTLFTYISGLGSSGSYPNSVGDGSGHADAVGDNFYSPVFGVATNVAHVNNYEVNYFYQTYIAPVSPPNPNVTIINQSYTFGPLSASTQQTVDKEFDNVAAKYNTLFVSAVDNGGNVHAPGTSYNCIGVAVYGTNASSSVGPTIDNGRCKPDITSPGWPAPLTSFSTPVVAGAAAVLMQAGLRGDGGSDTNGAANLRTIKALLLNGAVKPSNWTNANFSPLDARYGAGIVNLFNSYAQLAGGKHGYNFSTNVPGGTAHPPVVMTNAINAWIGWDFNTNTGSGSANAVKHYFFNATNAVSNATFCVTATLVWLRHQGESGITNLNLYLYNAANSNLVAGSTSLVDNVEHIYVPKLARGRYDLQVWMAGGAGSFSETYALAFNFAPPFIAQNGKTVAVTWPSYWGLDTTTNLASAWNLFTGTPTLTANGYNQFIPPATNKPVFFRLHRH
jgi:hypothetical protein